MARNRVIYNSEALFAGQKAGKACYEEDEGVNSIKQLHRVQNANYAFNVARTDIIGLFRTPQLFLWILVII